jgi:putative endonuclease
MPRKPSTRDRGAAGEDLAAAHLVREGWSVLERNFRSRAGEIDIIAEKDGEVAFVEVKAWRSIPAADLEFSVDGRKQRRIAEAARYYVSRRPGLAERTLRFDVIFLGGGDPAIRHIERAFNGGID